MAVVAAFELDDFILAGVAAGEAYRRNGRFGAAVHHAHHFERRNDLAEQFGDFDFELDRGAEAGADVAQGVFDCRGQAGDRKSVV